VICQESLQHFTSSTPTLGIEKPLRFSMPKYNWNL